MRKCYVCGRPLNDEQADELFLEDDDHRGVPVGSGSELFSQLHPLHER